MLFHNQQNTPRDNRRQIDALKQRLRKRKFSIHQPISLPKVMNGSVSFLGGKVTLRQRLTKKNTVTGETIAYLLYCWGVFAKKTPHS